MVWNSNIIESNGFFKTAVYLKNLYEKGISLEFIVFGEPMACENMSLARCTQDLSYLFGLPWFKFYGRVDRAKLIKLMTSCHIVALPSDYLSECQPLALIDAMVLGKYLLISNNKAIQATCRGYSGCSILSEHRVLSGETLVQKTAKYLPKSASEAQISSDRFSKERFNSEFAKFFLRPASTSVVNFLISY